VKKLGADHPHTLGTLINLAGAYLAAGKTAEAIALLEQVRNSQVKELGADHPHTLDTLARLAVAYQAAGKLEQALALLQQASVGIETRQFYHPNAGVIVGALIACHERLKHYDQAEAWRRKWLVVVKGRSGADSLPSATEMALLCTNLLKQKKFADAEPLARECLAIRAKKEPDAWTSFNSKSLLGAAMLGQKKYAEAERLLLDGYEGMKQREAKIPSEGKFRLTEAVERLVQLYESWGRPEQAANWRKELEARKKSENRP
jgi:tetratricopeptide (TPR) repeat protein